MVRRGRHEHRCHAHHGQFPLESLCSSRARWRCKSNQWMMWPRRSRERHVRSRDSSYHSSMSLGQRLTLLSIVAGAEGRQGGAAHWCHGHDGGQLLAEHLSPERRETGVKGARGTPRKLSRSMKQRVCFRNYRNAPKTVVHETSICVFS